MEVESPTPVAALTQGISEVEYCNRCILHTGISGVSIGEDGTCNYCKLHEEWNRLYPTGKAGRRFLEETFTKIREEGAGKPYDCVIGISGGCDSSFLLAYLVDYGLNPLPVHWDNNWNTETADQNIRKITQGLGLDLYRIGVIPEEYDDLCKAFLYASTPDADIPNDIALTTALYQAAERFNVQYIINAHSFRTEGTTPLGWTYMDGGYIESVHKQFGKIPLKTFPNLTYNLFKKYIVQGFKRIRPIWYLDYDKTRAIKELENRFGWRWYKGHHHENNYTIFVGCYLWPLKFGMDLRYVEYSALIRSGFKKLEAAKEEIQLLPEFDPLLPNYVRQRLGITKNEFNAILMAPPKTHHDYETYLPKFRQDKEFYQQAVKQKKIPHTFYKKYVEGVR
jgi:N-acetyl sugar amidotransferase